MMYSDATGQDFTYHAFLNCALEDKMHAEAFYNLLLQHGARVFYYGIMENGFMGSNPGQFMQEVLGNSRHFILYRTGHLPGTWISREIQYFDAHCKDGQNREILIYHDGNAGNARAKKNQEDYFPEVSFDELLNRLGVTKPSKNN